MSLPWPERRPSEEEALKYFNECVDTVSSASLRWRLKPRDERRLPAVLRDMFSAASEMKYQVVRVSCECLSRGTVSLTKGRIRNKQHIHFGEFAVGSVRELPRPMHATQLVSQSLTLSIHVKRAAQRNATQTCSSAQAKGFRIRFKPLSLEL
jgi:hypothetical protein